MTSRAVEATDIIKDAGAADLSLFSLMLQADIVVTGVMLMLLAASFWAWAIIFDKWRLFRSNRRRIAQFEQDYRNAKGLKQLYQNVKKQIDNPMSAMFVAAMYEMTSGMLKDIKKVDATLQQEVKERLYFVIHRVKNKTLDKMEKQLIVLATIAGASPFIGLFGTVWGIVNSFQSIAATNNTTLAVVAPGIAEALLATGMGLFAAIPAVIFYNSYSNEIRRMSMQLEDFTNELSTTLILSFSVKD